MRGASNNPQVVIFNNTGAVQYLKLFTPSPNALGSINARTRYTWDLTGFVFNSTTMKMTLAVTPVGSSLPAEIITVTLGSPNLAGVVTALNKLNLGSFYSLVIGGSSFIKTSNDRFVFGNLTINSTASVPFSVTGGVYGYQVGRYFYDISANALVDKGANQLVVFGSAVYGGASGETRWVLHDSTLVNPDIIFGLQAVSAGAVSQGKTIAMQNGYDTVLWQTSPDGITWTNVDAGLAVSNAIKGTSEDNGSTAASGSQSFSADLIFDHFATFGAVSAYQFLITGQRIARISPSPGGLGASGSLAPTSGLIVGATTTGTFTFAPATIAAGNQLSIGITFTVNYTIGSTFNAPITQLIGGALGFATDGAPMIAAVVAT